MISIIFLGGRLNGECLQRGWRRATLIASLLVGSFALASCDEAPSRPSGPTATAQLVPANGSNKGLSLAQVLSVAERRAEMSCIELTVGSLHAYALNVVAKSQNISADATTRAVSSAVASKAGPSIEKELQCHCDRGVAMPGYELFERRNLLQKNKQNKKLNPELISFYPKDASGQPRFLEIGERMSRATLTQLPPAPKKERFDDCGRKCKASRARTNAAAVAEGKPEPFPNLQYPRKAPCR